MRNICRLFSACKREEGQSLVESTLVFCFLSLFAIVMFVLIFSGSSVYHRVVERKKVLGNARTALHYVDVYVRQADAQNGVRVEQLPSGRNALALDLSEEAQGYTRWMFFEGGTLWECITTRGNWPEAALSERIIDAQNYTLTYDPLTRVLTQCITYTAQGQTRTLKSPIALRSAGKE